jgi:glucosylceramidase
MRPDGAGRAAHDQVGGEFDVHGVHLVAVQEPDEQADRHPAHLSQRLADRAERRAATANPPGPADPCCTGDVAANAADGDASTRYTTGAGQAPGQYLQVDFGRAVAARQVVFDTGVSTGDYPRGYTVTTSTDGVNWSTAVASAAGTGQFTTVPLTGAPVRYVRITLTAASGSWFSVADVRAYTAS